MCLTLHEPSTRTLNTSSSHIRRQRTSQKQHHFRSLMRSSRSRQGYIRHIPPFLCLERDPRLNRLAIQLEYFRLSRGSSNASIDPAVRHGVCADVVSIDGYGRESVTHIDRFSSWDIYKRTGSILRPLSWLVPRSQPLLSSN